MTYINSELFVFRLITKHMCMKC